jgi:hypothetical protein
MQATKDDIIYIYIYIYIYIGGEETQVGGGWKVDKNSSTITAEIDRTFGAD